MQTDYNDNLTLLREIKKGNEKAKSNFVSNNLALVKSIALRFCGRGQELEDLIEVGNIGLIKAIDGFDENKGFSFSTYAFSLISGEIKRFLRDDGLIKVSRATKKNAKTISKEREDFYKTYGREPKISELCSSLSLSREQVIEALETQSPVISLQDKVNNDSDALTVLDVFPAEDNTSLFIDSYALKEAINNLEHFDRTLIELRFFKNLTQTATAKILNISQVAVSRYEKKIIDKLRTYFL